MVDDKKYSKDIQEATHKLVDLCNSFVALSLQQTTWLRKNYAVKLNNNVNGIIRVNNSKTEENQYDEKKNEMNGNNENTNPDADGKLL